MRGPGLCGKRMGRNERQAPRVPLGRFPGSRPCRHPAGGPGHGVRRTWTPQAGASSPDAWRRPAASGRRPSMRSRPAHAAAALDACRTAVMDCAPQGPHGGGNRTARGRAQAVFPVRFPTFTSIWRLPWAVACTRAPAADRRWRNRRLPRSVSSFTSRRRCRRGAFARAPRSRRCRVAREARQAPPQPPSCRGPTRKRSA